MGYSYLAVSKFFKGHNFYLAFIPFYNFGQTLDLTNLKIKSTGPFRTESLAAYL